MDEIVKILRVIVASPSDVGPERERVGSVIDELNRTAAQDMGVRLELWKWETDSYPAFHPEGPQGHIDELMCVESSALLIGIFWKRFGTPVSDAQSGTEHEIRRALANLRSHGSPAIMLYFCKRPYTPTSVAELDQWRQVLAFKDAIQEEKGLYWSFLEVLDFERELRIHLQKFLKRTRETVPKKKSI